MTHPDVLKRLDDMTAEMVALAGTADAIFDHLARLKLGEPLEHDTEDVAEWADRLRIDLATIAIAAEDLKRNHALAGSST